MFSLVCNISLREYGIHRVPELLSLRRIGVPPPDPASECGSPRDPNGGGDAVAKEFFLKFFKGPRPFKQQKKFLSG
jgi:hypothetical protein